MKVLKAFCIALGVMTVAFGVLVGLLALSVYSPLLFVAALLAAILVLVTGLIYQEIV
jgi:amino acid transporter